MTPIRIKRREPLPAAAAIAWPADLHPVLQQVYLRRRITAMDDLETTLQGLIPVSRFAELDPAVDLLLAHQDQRIVIVGDFDSDGATSVALVVSTLRTLGFPAVDYFVPDRFELGYGLTPACVERVRALRPDLIVTVDNGISSNDGVALARSLGIRVLVTDHHLPPEQLPAADVIVNPNIPGVVFPGKALAGVGVAFYLMAAVGHRLGQPRVALAGLDLVALGTVADLVPLAPINRILVWQGLQRIRAGHCRPGIRALCEVAQVDPRSLAASHLGFQLGPRLNAAGRLEDMTIGVRCLLAESAAEAGQLAARLDALNRERRGLETRMRDEAMQALSRLSLDAEGESVVVLHHRDWHEGLVGLIASRVKDRVHRPVFVFASGSEGQLKGSGRSIAGFHLRDALALVDARCPGLIARFGGHAMAAGLTLASDQLDRFAAEIGRVGREWLAADALERLVLTDGEVPVECMSLEVAELLAAAGPWGQGFPEPVFDGWFTVVDWQWLKEVHLKLYLALPGSEQRLEAIDFNSEYRDPQAGAALRIAYRLNVNEFRDRRTLQLMVEHIEPA